MRLSPRVRVPPSGPKGASASLASAYGGGGKPETRRGAPDLEACNRLEGEDVDLSEVTASVGVATFPEHATDAESLFRAADTAMYSVKRAGKNRVAVASLVEPPRANAPDQRERTRNRRDP